MGGGYKIKNAEGKTIDTKKATLDAILDHFNIQVDNPMFVALYISRPRRVC